MSIIAAILALLKAIPGLTSLCERIARLLRTSKIENEKARVDSEIDAAIDGNGLRDSPAAARSGNAPGTSSISSRSNRRA